MARRSSAVVGMGAALAGAAALSLGLPWVALTTMAGPGGPPPGPATAGLNAGPPLESADGGRGPAALGIPGPMLDLYRTAAGACPGLSWTVLAAVGSVESDHGRSSWPGVRSGANTAGAEGPMQFEPATFARYARPVPAGGADPPSPYDAPDAVWAAARMLCADGAGRDPSLALLAYNHSTGYVAEVLARAALYQVADIQPADTRAAGAAGGDQVAQVALAAALSQVGVPYVLGAEAPGVGFDCSGLVQYAYRVAGVRLPRTTWEQAEAGVGVPVAAIRPGDLVFFAGGGAGDLPGGTPVDPLGHVGIYLGGDRMVEAPHSGARVSVATFAPSTVEAARRVAGP